MIKPENTKTVKRYTSASTLAMTELWLRKEAKNGWRLDDVKERQFFNKYFFVKSKSCDEVYFGTVGFSEKEKNLRNTEGSILSYLKAKYHLKPINNKKWCFWYKIKREHITDISDVKINMLIREKCISKSYNTYLWGFGVCAVLFAVLFYQGSLAPVQKFAMPIFFSAMFLLILAKKINHKRNVKIAYENFLTEE